MPVSIRDLARAAGVSVGTVSRALKHQQGLSNATRERILQLAQELGYDKTRLRPDPIRRVLCILHSQHEVPQENPFYSEVLKGAAAACQERGISCDVLSLSPAKPARRQILRQEPDALLCIGFFEPETLEIIRSLGKPVVLSDMNSPGWPAVNTDNQQGAWLATQHLIAGGRQRIAFLSGSLAHYSIRLRERGYRQALFDAGRLADPALETLIPPGMDIATGAPYAMRELLALPERPDAIFAYNDATALAAMRVCQEAGLRVPQDIAFVGFDDLGVAATAQPGLTTLAVDKIALGREGISLLLSGPNKECNALQPVQLIVRESSAAKA
ncbi:MULTISPECIES: LacI family DNA-binding transcriptional regulator [Silvimonas]|uniref:LacI family DNA-binding transcriptional regulator n=1 Tax=Silvimonas TaxID=300264 RepID=UPI0024B3B049|nr:MULTISPECIES: LacI family DNA-binding transcriptional regulator [Silvimonas]MDR3429211.1 LacI family DNA-binding transcriptional regulator [Silvimonas sp.]